MKRTPGHILILADDEPGLSALELALLARGANVLRSEPESAVHLLEKSSVDCVIMSPSRVDGRVASLLELPGGPALVALVPEAGERAVREALAVGARDYLVRPALGDGVEAAERTLAVLTTRLQRSSQRQIREAESLHRLKQQVKELTERYVRQCRTFDEAQDVFYLDLSRMMTIFDNIMDGIVFTDVEGQITLMNPVAEELLGVRTIFAIGKCVRELGHGNELIDEVATDHESALIDGGVSERTSEVHVKGKDLSYLKLRTTAVADYKGSFAGILTVIKDVTSEYKSEQMRNQYLSIVSHELRTPLTGIKTFASLMAKGSIGPLSDKQQSVIDSIREQTLRLEHEVDKLICLGRIDSGDFAADSEEFEMIGMLSGIVAPFAQIARDRGIEFNVRAPTESQWVLADRENLKRALQALVENAIKFTSAGGRVDVFLDDRPDEVRIHVRDTGLGISPRYHRRIFDKFFQVEDPLTRHFGGAGLGLNVAHGVAKSHQGRVEVISDLGQGAEFIFCLPRIQPAARQPTETSQAAVVSGRKEQ